MKAIVIGGTGATGKALVKQLIEDERISQVTLLLRRSYFDPHPKLQELVVDFEKLHEYTDLIQGQVAFSCLGTTLKDAGSKATQWRVDHDYQLKFAALAKENGIESFVLLSSVGANADSFFFYNKLKGTLEQNIQHLGFKQFIILRPGAIDRPNSNRKNEKNGISILRAVNKIGLFTNYEPITVNRLAYAMLASYFKFKTPVKALSLSEIKALSKDLQ